MKFVIGFRKIDLFCTEINGKKNMSAPKIFFPVLTLHLHCPGEHPKLDRHSEPGSCIRKHQPGEHPELSQDRHSEPGSCITKHQPGECPDQDHRSEPEPRWMEQE